ncbi:MAG: cytochrome c biogenesis protein CcsA [Acidobacteria bacterium]|nr:cytochrome c biogenesis protein CcsA [Acidobacteriota bacterium]
MSTLWLKVAVLLYGIAALAVLPAVLYNRPRWKYLALPACVAAALFHFVSLTETLAAAHRFIPVEATEIQAMLALLLALAFLWTYGIYRTLSLGIVLLPVIFLLGLRPAFAPGQSVLESPVLRSGWIWLHIALLLAAYAALILSLLASVLYLLQEKRLKSHRTGGWISALPPLATTDSIALKSLLIGLPCMTAGLLIGSLLAQQMYGVSYFSDPKVLLSFAMWLAYIAMIAIRRVAGLRGRRAVFLSAFVFFVMLAVWSANQVSSVHQYAVRP